MNLPYIIQVQVCIAIFWLIYRVLMRGSGLFNHNRFYLLGAIAAAFIIPFLSIPLWPAVPATIQTVPTIDIGELEMLMAVIEPQAAAETVSWKAIALFLAGAGTLAMLCGVLIQIFRIMRSTQRSRIVESEHGRIVFNRKIKTPYSFFGYIFINEQEAQSRDFPQIVAHEMAHVRLGHSYDSVFAQLMLVFFWWNPFVWLWSRSLKEIHEYQADAAVLDQGFDSKQYITLLIGTLADIHPEFVSGFSYSLIKNRLLMMTKQTGRTAKWRVLAAIPAVGAALLLFSFTEKKEERITDNAFTETAGQPDEYVLKSHPGVILNGKDTIFTFQASMVYQTDDPDVIRLEDAVINHGNDKVIAREVMVNTRTQEYRAQATAATSSVQQPPPAPVKPSPADDEEPFLTVENMPTFQGEGNSAFRTWVMNQLDYPKEAAEKNIQGRVTLQFVVEKDGSVSNIEIISSPDESLSAESIRVVSSSPQWEAGTQRGKKVRVRFTLPIDFRMRDHSADAAKGEESGFITLKNARYTVGEGTVIYGDEIKINTVPVTVSSTGETRVIGIKLNEDGTRNLAATGAPTIYVNGGEYNGSLESLNSDSIESISVTKDDPEFPHGQIKVTLKEGTATKVSTDAHPHFFISATSNTGGTVSTTIIRGNGEKQGSPLVIINGVPQSSDFNMDELNPETIESISVLKDQSATAVWGERGKNGVIMIEQKKSSATD